jgi:eukaryotic-like serine/threonine-protein kinase
VSESNRPPADPDPDDVTLVGARTREVEVERVVSTGPPVPPDDQAVSPRIVTENERVRVEDDGTVSRRVDRVEQEPVVRRRSSGLVPALLIILALALGVIAAAWYFSKSDTKEVPSVVGLPLDTAVSRVQDEGFKSDIVSEPNDAQEGTVFRQSPDGGTEHDEGSTVQLLVSKGPLEATVPNAVGVSETDARDRLAAVGLKANVVDVFADADPGEVVAQAPAAGESAAKGSTVRLNVSKGSKLVTVPTVVGSTEVEATTQVKDAGLVPNVVSVPSDQPAGTVVAQHPTGGQATRGSTVRLNVSTGPQ